ncbi:MAG: hypothetical protein GX321_09790 [Clostridiales bacterium]|nr:hypothetical protein [Clostridiales bacterium]
MLRKLLKHELYATGKYLLPIYGITLILSLVNRLVINVDIFNGALNFIPVFMMIAYVISIIASLFVTFIFMIVRFYKNLMSDEGYLMFTLPVKPTQLVNSKLITSIIWTIVSVITICLSLLLLIATPERLNDFKNALDEIFYVFKASFGKTYALVIIEFILMIISSLFQSILLIYVSIAVGHLFNGHRVLGSFVAYFVISTAVQILITLLLLIVASISGSNIETMEAIPHMVFPFSIIVSLLLSTAYYSATSYIFSRKLNLE